MLQASRSGRLAVWLVALVLLAGAEAAKKPKKTWHRIGSMEELVQKQNQVLIEAAGLAQKGDFINAADLLQEFANRVDGLETSGALGAAKQCRCDGLSLIATVLITVM